ncbi:shufflon system plasmid conjugative transfer pilus tip adhesin PilV, partial [Escherichia coli]|nr:shufflon system plasmid conjugative transfer pilus tip adhesin PilV [Escherichia coli]
NEFVQINGVATAGWACSPNGLVGRDASGGILSCQSGVWTSSGKVSSFEMVQGNDACGKYVYSKAYCPAGKQLISGGFVLSNWTGGSGWNAPDSSMPSPSENAWQLVTGGGVTGGTCMRAIAWCAKN